MNLKSLRRDCDLMEEVALDEESLKAVLASEIIAKIHKG